MENPFAPKIDNCTPCEANAVIDIKNCHHSDPRLMTISISGVGSAIVFFKDTVRVVSKALGCSPDVFPVKGGDKPSLYDHVVLAGKMVYAEEMGLHFPPKPKKHSIELDPATTTINGTSFGNATDLAAALQQIVADCECDCEESPKPPPPPDILWFKITGLSRDGFDVFLKIESSGFKNFRLLWKPPPGEPAGQTSCIDSLLLPFGDGQQYLAFEGITTFTVKDCNGNLPSKSFTSQGFKVELGTFGAFTATMSPTVPTCLSSPTDISVFATDNLTGVSVNLLSGEITVPFQQIAGEGYIGLLFVCVATGEVLGTVMYTLKNPPAGLLMRFNSLANMPTGVTDPANTVQWNSLFNLPAYGNDFDGVYVGGDMVMLHDSSTMNINEMPPNLFASSGLIYFQDFGFVVYKIGAQSFLNSIVQLVYVPNCTIIGTSAFAGCASLKTVNAQSATAVGSYAFQNCVNLSSVNLQSVINLGLAADDDTVFQGIVGLTVKIRVPIALQTADAGNMHASLATLDANNTVLFTWV